MKIGIDLDGVIFDSEKIFRVYSELYDMLELRQNGKVDNKQQRFEDRFNWTEEQARIFFDKYHQKTLEEANYMPGAQMILKMLKQDGHELIIVTARGITDEGIITFTNKKLKQDGMDIFDKYCYCARNKADVCEKENIDIMIDDLLENCKNVAQRKIKTIYLKDAICYEAEENEYIKTLYNWGEIYRYIKETV